VTSRADIVVVGAGIIGCAVASELARRGATVALLDDRAAGMGATQAAAGVLAPYLEARAGGPLLELTARSLDLFDSFVARVQAATGLTIEYRRTGSLDVALSDVSARALLAARDSLAARGVAAEWLDAPALQAREPLVSDAALGGLAIAAHGYVGAVDLTQALAAECRAHGVAVLEPDRVIRIAPQGSGLSVTTTRDRRHVGAVVVAAGSWTGQIELEGTHARVPVKPVRGQLLHLGWQGSTPRGVIWGERGYLVPWRDRTVLVGATVEDAGFDERTTVEGIRELIDLACAMVPDAARASLLSARVGLRPGTPDQLPILGPSSVLPRVAYATGHYRNGILLAPLTATLVADALLDGSIDPMLAATRPDRFGPL
jgi:glycine oxidase